MRYQRHPISAAFPDLNHEDLHDLKESIKSVGVVESIVLHDGMVLDGWQRYTITNQLGMPCPVKTFTGSPQTAIAYALAKQTRRNMTKMERATVLIRLHGSQLAPRGNHSKSAKVADFVSLTQLAAQTGIGERTLRRARRLDLQAVPSVNIVHSRGLITSEEAEKIASLPKAIQPSSLRRLLDLKRLKRKPQHPHGFVHMNGHYIIDTERDRELAVQVVHLGIVELQALVMSGKNICLVAAACVARRSANEQLKILQSSAWVRGLRHLPRSRFERRQLRTNPYYFERG